MIANVPFLEKPIYNVDLYMYITSYRFSDLVVRICYFCPNGNWPLNSLPCDSGHEPFDASDSPDRPLVNLLFEADCELAATIEHLALEHR